MKPACNLPILDMANRMHPHVDLSDVAVVACQHFFLANYLMFEQLFERNLRPANTFIIPKSYTYNATVERLFLDRGVFVWQYDYDSHHAFDERMRAESRAFVEFIRRDKLRCDKILVLDDGGDLTQSVNEALGNRQCHGVEQTSSGFNKLVMAELGFPVVNLARSHSKLHVESLFIAERMCFKTLEFLYEKSIEIKNCLILGNGPIGAEVHRSLARFYPADLFDVDESRSALRGELADRIGDYDLIFGCSGKLSVPEALQARIREHAVLVCASLREFEPHRLRRRAPRSRDPHEHMYVDGKWLVNSGFPVNFDGRINDVIPEKIQLTHALMLSGAYQALDHEERGLVDLDAGNQDRIVAAFKNYMVEHYFKLYREGGTDRP